MVVGHIKRHPSIPWTSTRSFSTRSGDRVKDVRNRFLIGLDMTFRPRKRPKQERNRFLTHFLRRVAQFGALEEALEIKINDPTQG